MTMLCVYLTLSLTACNTLEKNLHSSTEIIEQEDKTNGVLSQEDSIKTQIAIFAEETMQAYTATHTATNNLTPSPMATEHPTQTPTESPHQAIPCHKIPQHMFQRNRQQTKRA